MKIILISLALLFAVGCISAEYQDPNGAKITYTRIGDIDVKGLHIETPDGVYIGLESTKSDARLLKDALEMAIEMYKLGRAATP